MGEDVSSEARASTLYVRISASVIQSIELQLHLADV
jgi:hypothetical protein